ncbi:hypothetical protein CL620_00245 [archaeon]|nr:hypothetical protein [archaeon]
MVQFGSGYFNPMDRGYEVPTHHGHSHDHDNGAAGSNDVGVSIGELGMSMGLGPIPNVNAISAKLRPGTKKLEFVFLGRQKGSGQGQTPGMYGLKQRQALREMGTANRIDFTTHSTVGVMGLAGMDQQGNFSKASKDQSLHEVQRAIEFAADVAKGGPVVVHTGEFNRSIADSKWNKDTKWAGQFEMHPEEEERATYRVVDTRTGRLIQEAMKNKNVSRPIWNFAKEGEEYEDFDGNMKKAAGHRDEKGNLIYMDYFGKRIEARLRVPLYNEDEGKFETEQLKWADLQREAQDMTRDARNIWKKWKRGELSDSKFQDSYWKRFKDVTSADEIEVKPEEAYVVSTLETSAANARGWAHHYGAGFKESVETLKKLRKAFTFYEKLEGITSEEEKWKLMKEDGRRFTDLIPADTKLPTVLLKKLIQEQEGRMKQAQESGASQWAQTEEQIETIRHIQSAETYAYSEATDAYARLGMNAMRHTDKLKAQGDSKKPLAVALENLFPESYGSHPDEIVDLVKGSRKRMQEMLVQNGMNKEKAMKRATEHLTITFDTGHINMWRKYWKGDPNKTLKENDDKFDEWVIDKVKDMAPYIGHVHIDDNYGYHDDHLAPGEGNTPIKAMIKTLKENGYKGEMIIEPGADYTTDTSGFSSVTKTWRHFGIPLYGTGSGRAGGGGRTWNQVGYGFFGQNQPAYFTFGGYSPSEDWTLWSGVPLE